MESSLCKRSICLLPAVSLLLPALSDAQTVAPDGGTIIQTIPRAPQLLDKAPDIDQVLLKRKVVEDSEDFRVSIKTFTVKGLTVLQPDEARAVLAPFVGNDKSFVDIQKAAAALRRRIAQEGYFLADVVIPEQAITGNGWVELLVLEGRVGTVSVEYADDVRINRRIVESYLSRIREGDLINTRNVERALFLVNDLRGIVATSTFKPGKKTGTADLVVRVESAPIVDGYVDYDVNGPEASGKSRLGVNLNLNNLLQQGGLLNVRAFSSFPALSSMDDNRTTYGRASVVMPLWASEARGGLTYSNLDYKLQSQNLEQQGFRGLSGSATTISAFVSYPFVRSRNLNIVGTAQFDRRSFDDSQVLPSPGTNEKSVNATVLQLGGDFRDSGLGGGINLFSLSFTRGKLDLISPTLVSQDIGLRTEGVYTKWNASIGRLQQLPADWLLFANLQAQAAGKNLDSSESIVLGGPYGVRASAPTEAIGDRGYLATLELRHPLFQKSLGGALMGALFYDFGSVQRNKTPPTNDLDLNRVSISGVGVGLYWEPKGWYVRTSLAWRTGDDPFRTSRDVGQDSFLTRSPRLYLQALKYF